VCSSVHRRLTRRSRSVGRSRGRPCGLALAERIGRAVHTVGLVARRAAILRGMKVYFAGPLFSTQERTWNADLAAGLRAAGHEIFLPHEQEPGTAYRLRQVLREDLAVRHVGQRFSDFVAWTADRNSGSLPESVAISLLPKNARSALVSAKPRISASPIGRALTTVCGEKRRERCSFRARTRPMCAERAKARCLCRSGRTRRALRRGTAHLRAPQPRARLPTDDAQVKRSIGPASDPAAPASWRAAGCGAHRTRRT
jgi:hypothetical protein